MVGSRTKSERERVPVCGAGNWKSPTALSVEPVARYCKWLTVGGTQILEIQKSKTLPLGHFEQDQPQHLIASAVIHRPTRFRETRLKTFREILFKDKHETLGQAEVATNILGVGSLTGQIRLDKKSF